MNRLEKDSALRSAKFDELRVANGGIQTDVSTFVIPVTDADGLARLVEVSVVLKKPEANLEDMLDAWEILKVERENKAMERRIKRDLKASEKSAKAAKKAK